jgi:hypothetical protein
LAFGVCCRLSSDLVKTRREHGVFPAPILLRDLQSGAIARAELDAVAHELGVAAD